ncbi:hypothetical protein C8R44DRAFT_895100 [Mycena epipterygia]|nr:hypothetical protein C8R44DRAFT_895100 [Mycena epipterygia]
MGKRGSHSQTFIARASNRLPKTSKTQRRPSDVGNTLEPKPSLASRISSSEAPPHSADGTIPRTFDRISSSSMPMSGIKRKRESEDDSSSEDRTPSLLKWLNITLIERLDFHPSTIGIAPEQIITTVVPREVDSSDQFPANDHLILVQPPHIRTTPETSRNSRKHKKPCLDPSKFGFNANAIIADAGLSGNKRKVLETIENYTRDIKETLRLIRSMAGCPVFTETGWKDVPAGNYVDFHEIAQTLLGNKQITTQGQWVDIWGKFKRCICFPLEGRNEELETYFDYIQGLFESVMVTLEEGAWPFASTKHADGFPLTYDNSRILPKSEREREFLEVQSKEEEDLGRHSPAFGPDLLPGMYSTLVLAVPKPHSDLCSHMSAGEFCQNNMMDRKETKGARLDKLHNFIPAVLNFRRRNPGKRLVAFKSDAKSAFRLVPCHPLWQIKQVVTTNYPTRADVDAGANRGPLIRRVDWRCCFGSRGSPRTWSSVMALVLWVALHEKHIPDLYAYVDDEFGLDIEGRLTFYPPYRKYIPTNQVWGGELIIIGFLVDVNKMTITLPTAAKADLVAAVEDFINTASRKRSLHDWGQLSGWISWSLNVFPLLRPALCNVYVKISEKSTAAASIYINVPVKQDLSWFLNHIRTSSGIFLFDTIDWDPYNETDFILCCDACPSGMGFWTEGLKLGFYSQVPRDAPKDTIFFWEATPAAEPTYNVLLKAAVDLLVAHHVDLRVLHIPGEDNKVADAISREIFILAYTIIPDLIITAFQPPQCTMGAAKQ